MKQFVCITILILFKSVMTFGQSANDSILIGNNKGDIKCYQSGILLTDMDYNFIFKNNPLALHEIKISRNLHKTGIVFGYIGGLVFGLCLGSALSGDHIDYTWWWTIGSSAAVVGTALILDNSSRIHHRNAVKQFNSTIGVSSYNIQHILKFGISDHGLSLVYKL